MTKAEAAAAIALAAEIKRRAQGPDHMARDGVTWTDLREEAEIAEQATPRHAVVWRRT